MLHRFNYRYGGHWRFPKMLDYCYLMDLFPDKAYEGQASQQFRHPADEYPSGMFVNSHWRSKYFGIRQDYVVVGNVPQNLSRV